MPVSNKTLTRKALRTFRFYAKALRTFGKKATFDQIEPKNSSWNILKFMKFCNEFKLLQEDLTKRSSHPSVQKSTVNTLVMHLPEFVKALGLLADLFYSQNATEKRQTTPKASGGKAGAFLQTLGIPVCAPAEAARLRTAFSQEKLTTALTLTTNATGLKSVRVGNNNLTVATTQEIRSEARPE